MSAMAASWLEMPVAGPRGRRRLDVEHRRQRVGLDRHVLLETRPSPRSAAGTNRRNDRRRAARRPPWRRPVGLEALVGVIAALGRLDPGELDAAVGDRVPVDLALVLRDVDAVDRIVARCGIVVVDEADGIVAAPAQAASTPPAQARRAGNPVGSETIAFGIIDRTQARALCGTRDRARVAAN